MWYLLGPYRPLALEGCLNGRMDSRADGLSLAIQNFLMTYH